MAPLGFELAGGTALAAGYLGYRRPDDLDLSSGLRAPDDWAAAHAALADAWRRRGPSVKTEGVQKICARYGVGRQQVKIDLAQDNPYRLAPSNREVDGMPVRSLQDLEADKTLALGNRVATRDFVHVYMLLQRFELSQLMKWARQRDPGFNGDGLIRALVQVERVDPADVTLLVPLDGEHLRLTFRQAAMRLDRAAREGAEWD